MIEVAVDRIVADKGGRGFIVLLRDTAGKRLLPVQVDFFEGQGILVALSKTTFNRPLTHDLLKAVLDGLDAQVVQVVISKGDEHAVSARIKVSDGKRSVDAETRPSDAIALALKTGSPLLVTEELMTEASVPEVPSAPKEPVETAESLRQKLEEAVRREDYEEAAKLRDRIHLLEAGGQSPEDR